MQTLHIDAGFRSLLPALSPEELKLLERNLSTDGCREPLVVWESEEDDEPVILDGHNRYEICTCLGIEFETVDVEDCPTREAAIAWIAANQLGRRNLTPSQKGVLALEIEKQLAAEAKKRQREAAKETNEKRQGNTFPKVGKSVPSEPHTPIHAEKEAARMLGVSHGYVADAKQIANDAPEVLEHVKQGKLSIPQAKKVAALPVAQRPAAIERMRNKESEEGGQIYRDGKLVAVQTNKEVAVWSHRLHQVVDAIEALATVDVSPEEYLRTFQPSYADQIDEHLLAATRWLKHFVKCWEERNAKAA